MDGWSHATWNYAKNSCGGGDCQSYLNLVNQKSTRLGCSYAICSRNSPFGNLEHGQWVNFVCNYSPPYVSGQKPWTTTGRLRESELELDAQEGTVFAEGFEEANMINSKEHESDIYGKYTVYTNEYGHYAMAV